MDDDGDMDDDHCDNEADLEMIQPIPLSIVNWKTGTVVSEDQTERKLSDAEMEGMHSCFRTIVKQIGGLVNIESNQFSLQKYIRSSVIQKRRILEEE
jgi:hypothetical protein